MDDCAEQLVRLCLKPQISHFAYNNGGETVTAAQIAEVVRHWLPDAANLLRRIQADDPAD